MGPLLLNPDVADRAPDGDELTVYDEEHAVTYCRMLDAERASADWREVAKIVLHIDPEAEGDRARRAFSTPTLRVQNGWRERAIDSFCAEAR